MKQRGRTVVLFKRKRDVRRFLLILLVVVIVIQATVLVTNFSASQPLQQLPPSQPLPTVPLSLEGFQEVEITVSPSIIYLTAGCQQLTMVTTEFQTYSIKNGLDKKVDFRPTSHDVFKDLIENFGIAAKMVRIESLDDSTYYAKLYVQQGNKLLGLDSKPSDAIGVAVRFDVPVYIRTTILTQNGKIIC